MDITNIKVEEIKHYKDNIISIIAPEKNVDLGNGIERIINFNFVGDGIVEPQLGDIITIKGIRLGKNEAKVVKQSLDIWNFYNEIIINESGNVKQKNQEKVLSWINGLDGFRLNVSWDVNMNREIITFANTENYEVIENDMILDTNAVVEELERYIIAHPGDFQLKCWIGATPNIVTCLNNSWPWWHNDREVEYKKGDGGFIPPAFFGSEARYQRIFEKIKGNLTAQQYNEIDKNDGTKDMLVENALTIMGLSKNDINWETYKRQNSQFKQQDTGHKRFVGSRDWINDNLPNTNNNEEQEHNRKVDEYYKKLSPDIGDDNFRETKDNFLADANEGKFDEVNRDLVNKIRAKLYEEDKETGMMPTDDLLPISKIEVGDNADQKQAKITMLENMGPFNEKNIEKRKEILILIKDLQRKQDEYINQNNKNSETADNDTSNNNQSLSKLRKKIISLINNALHNQEPKISSNELEPDNHNWEQIINNESISKEEMNNLKERLLFDISGKREAKFSADRLKSLIAEAKKLNNYEELVKRMSQIEKFRGQSGYNSLQNEINDLEMKLAQLKPENYRKDSVKAVNQKLTQNGVKKSDLSSEAKKELEKVENGEITDPQKIKEIKDKSMNEIAQKCSDRELDKIIKEYLSAPNDQAKNAAKRKLFSFVSNANNFHKQSYQKQKKKVNTILGIKNISQEEKTPSKFPTMLVVIISTSLTFFIGAWLIIRHHRLKKKKSI